MATNLTEFLTTHNIPSCYPMVRSDPIDIPARRSEPHCVTYSHYDHLSLDGSDLLFEMDQTYDTPVAQPAYVHDEPFLYTFPTIPNFPLTSVNNGQSKAPTPFLSPSSSCSSASDTSEFINRVDNASGGTRRPFSSKNNAIVVCAVPATKISGFVPSFPSSAASSYNSEGDGSSTSTTTPRCNRRRHSAVVAQPPWHRSNSLSMNSENLNMVDEPLEAAMIERVPRFYRKRNVSSDARF